MLGCVDNLLQNGEEDAKVLFSASARKSWQAALLFDWQKMREEIGKDMKGGCCQEFVLKTRN